MIADFFDALTQSGSSFVQFLVNVIQSIWAIFYNSSPADGEKAGFTSMGLFIIVSITIGIVYGVIRWVSKLIHLRG
ncbi:MAG: hypothetical protein HDT32_01675 [Clostridiales bacterium]|nr:hypothetical protein [Clostridiales bacterium]